MPALAHIEPVAGVLRVFSEGRQFGDEYEWACSVRWVCATAVELMGVTQTLRPSQWRAIIATMREHGVKRIIYERKCGANPGRRVLEVK